MGDPEDGYTTDEFDQTITQSWSRVNDVKQRFKTGEFQNENNEENLFDIKEKDNSTNFIFESNNSCIDNNKNVNDIKNIEQKPIKLTENKELFKNKYKNDKN